jgi:hypothetical protein
MIGRARRARRSAGALNLVSRRREKLTQRSMGLQ